MLIDIFLLSGKIGYIFEERKSQGEIFTYIICIELTTDSDMNSFFIVYKKIKNIIKQIIYKMFTLNSIYKLSTRTSKIWKVQIAVNIYSTVAEDISEKCI